MAPADPTHDYYSTLEIPRTATYEEVKKSYRILARIHHPDKNNGLRSATEKTQLVSETARPQRAANAELIDRHRSTKPGKSSRMLEREESTTSDIQRKVTGQPASRVHQSLRVSQDGTGSGLRSHKLRHKRKHEHRPKAGKNDKSGWISRGFRNRTFGTVGSR